MNQTQIYLKKKLKVILPEKDSFNNQVLVASIGKNIESLGYSFTPKVFSVLASQSKQYLSSFYSDIVPILKEMCGAHVQYNPVYPNFPQQVMDASDFELYINAIIHYWSVFLKDLDLSQETWLPKYNKTERLPLTEKNKLDLIKIGDVNDFNSIFTSLISSKTSISEFDKEIVEWFIIEYKDNILSFLPATIPLKENLALIIGKCIDNAGNLINDYIKVFSDYIKTSTDILRVITVLSGGDVSLAQPCKFKKFSRFYRRVLLSLLNNISNPEEDMVRFKNQWLRIGEILHPGEYSNKFPKAFSAFQLLRSNVKILTFNSEVEHLLLNNKVSKLVELLKNRPGEFCRRLDKVIRDNPRSSVKIIDAFSEVKDKVSTPVLLQVYNHFKYRNNIGEFRTFFPKGNIAKAKVIVNDLPKIGYVVQESIFNIASQGLKNRFKKLPKLDNVYINDELKNYKVPFAMRSASKALKTFVRGSKINLNTNNNILRFFIWWKNAGKNNDIRTDIDLSASLFDDNWNLIENIAYFNLRDRQNHIARHSGDITDAPNGACEFIDLDVLQAKNNKIRFVAMSVNCFTSVPFVDLPECFAGWMVRQNPQSGEIFEPKTVQNKIDLSSNTRYCIPMIFDLVDEKVIWTDLSLKNNPCFVNNVNNNKKSLQLTCRAMLNLNKPNLYDLLSLHAKCRGKIVKNKSEANTIFDTNFAFENDRIVSEFI